MAFRYLLTVSFLTVFMTNFAHSALRCSELIQNPIAWASNKFHFETLGELQLRGYRNGQYLYIEAHGNRRKATDSEKSESLQKGMDTFDSDYRPLSGTFEQAQESIPWFLDTVDKVNSFAPKGGIPSSLDIVIRLDSNKNGQLSWFRPVEPEEGFYTGSRILMSLKVVNSPAKFGKMPLGIDVPQNIIQTVFAHEYGHSIFTQLMRLRGLDYDRKLQEINRMLDNRFLEGLQRADRELGVKSSDLGLVSESVFAHVADPSNRDSLVRQKKKIRNLVSPYSELFADVVDALTVGSLTAHSEAINFYQTSIPLVRALYGEVESEWYEKNYMGTTRSFLESGSEKQEYDTKKLESWHEALDPVRAYLGKSGLISDGMTTDQKRAFLNHLINIIVDEINAKEALVTADNFPAKKMSADLIQRLQKDFGR